MYHGAEDQGSVFRPLDDDIVGRHFSTANCCRSANTANLKDNCVTVQNVIRERQTADLNSHAKSGELKCKVGGLCHTATVSLVLKLLHYYPIA